MLAGMNRGFWLDVKTPSGLGAGDYKSEIVVNTGGGKPIKLPFSCGIFLKFAGPMSGFNGLKLGCSRDLCFVFLLIGYSVMCKLLSVWLKGG